MQDASQPVENEASGPVVVEWLETVDSTNDELRRRFVADPSELNDYFTLATRAQTAGRGRLEREWVDTPDASLAISTYCSLDSRVARTAVGWITLAAGAALHETLAPLLAAGDSRAELGLKWPNDVLLDGKKTAGILGEMLGVLDGGDRFGFVLGTGINLRTPEPEGRAAAPLSNATSLAAVGCEPDVSELVRIYADALARRILALEEHDGDADASGLRGELLATLGTIGQRVRIARIGAEDLVGTAVDLSTTGELIVECEDGERHTVQVGDVEHLRPLATQADEQSTSTTGAAK